MDLDDIDGGPHAPAPYDWRELIRVARAEGATAERERRAGVLDGVLTGGNHLALHIGADHPPYTASCDAALTHYGAGWRYDVWCCWRAIMHARDAAAILDERGRG